MNCYYAWCKDLSVLSESSSGGIFSVIADQVLKNQGVVFGAAINCESSVVYHTMIDKTSNLHLLRKSKYQQSVVGESYKQVSNILKEDKDVFFSGTPCQVAGLISYLALKGVNRERLITAEILCHGVTNAEVVRSYLSGVSEKYGKRIINYEFRTKDKPWYHSGSSMHIIFDDGHELYRSSYVDEFYVAYTQNLILRPSCYKCKYAKKDKRLSDFTLGDFWGAEEYIKDKMTLNQGVGIVLTNTEKGETILQNLIKEEQVIAKKLDFDIGANMNPAMIRPANINLRREEFFQRIKKEEYFKIINDIYGKAIKKGRIHHLIGHKAYHFLKRLKNRRKK